MMKKWSKRLAWFGMLVFLSMAPAQLAHRPETAQTDDAAVSYKIPSPIQTIAAGLAVLGVAGIFVARRRRAWQG